MDEERNWQRVTDVVRKVAQETAVPAPTVFEKVAGDAWERNAQRRAALETFADQVPDFPRFTTDAPVDKIADELDAYWLEAHMSDEEDAE